MGGREPRSDVTGYDAMETARSCGTSTPGVFTVGGPYFVFVLLDFYFILFCIIIIQLFTAGFALPLPGWYDPAG